MNKNLIALATLAMLASSGAALAQSTVTIYGRLDASVGTQDTGTGSNSKMFSGGTVGLTTPRLGFMGSEDLGGGLKANFKLEQRIDLDTGALQAPSFKGESSLGLSGSFGAVRAGRMTTVYDDIRTLANSRNLWDSNGLSPTNNVYKSTGNSDYSSRFNSQLRYDTPVFGGVYGGVSYAFEQTAAANDKLVGFVVGYKTADMNIALALQDEKTKQKYTLLAGTYDFGSFAVSAGVNQRSGATAAAGDDNEYNMGVEVPVGAFKLSAGYAYSKTKVAGAITNKSSGFGLGGTYSLSKRTRLYAGYSNVEAKNAASVVTGKNKIFAMGVRHDF